MTRCPVHQFTLPIEIHTDDGSRELRCPHCRLLLERRIPSNPTRDQSVKHREFVLKVQEVSHEVEAISLIEQVFKIYPKVDRVAIATYFQRRLVAE